MSIAPAPASPFEQLSARPGDELAATALAAATQAGDDPRNGSLVVVVHPEGDEHRILAAAGTGVLRAAVSVAVASGNHRLWADAPTDDTIEHPVRALPEVVRAAAEASEIVATHTGTVRLDDRLDCVAIWFESEAGVAPIADRRHTLALLAAAAEHDAHRASEIAAVKAAEAASNPISEAADSESRQFDPNDPDLDALTGVANRDCFEQALENYDSDHATLIVIDIDHFDQIIAQFGNATADRVLVATADRLIEQCRRSDLVARIDADTFAVLFGDVDRATALQVSKRLLSRIAEPLPPEHGPDGITATVALAHQFGLVDTEELMESATHALDAGKRSGRGRLFLGS